MAGKNQNCFINGIPYVLVVKDPCVYTCAHSHHMHAPMLCVYICTHSHHMHVSMLHVYTCTHSHHTHAPMLHEYTCAHSHTHTRTYTPCVHMHT